MAVSLQSVKRVVANVVDFDMHNLFPPYTWNEGLQEAAKGTFEAVPPSTVQIDLHAGRPLKIMPEYGKNFLDRLRSKSDLEHIVELFKKKAADPNNLWDFSMPSEMHKHQEQPTPLEMIDDFHEFNRPGEGAGLDILKEYHDRGWGVNEAPEMSEDIILRRSLPPKSNPLSKPMKVNPIRIIRAFFERMERRGPDVGIIVSSFLMKAAPQELALSTGMHREAAKLSDLTHPMVYNKEKGYHPLDAAGTTSRLIRANPRQARWTFRSKAKTKGEKDYTVTFQFKPKGNQRDLNKLDTYVSCNCPSWIYYGAQYNAFMGDYLYGPIQLRRGPFGRPRVRDPQSRFTCCKHILSCIPIITGKTLEGEKIERAPGYILQPVPAQVRKRMEKELKTKAVVEADIPKDLEHLVDNPQLEEATNKWNTWSQSRKSQFINSLKDPDQVAYMAYRFPETGTAPATERLKDMALKGSMPNRTRAEELMGDLGYETKIPKDLIGQEDSPEIGPAVDTWHSWSPARRKQFINGLQEPDSVAYFAYKFPETATVFVADRLKALMAKPDKKVEAQQQLTNIL